MFEYLFKNKINSIIKMAQNDINDYVYKVSRLTSAGKAHIAAGDYASASADFDSIQKETQSAHDYLNSFADKAMSQ